MQDEFQGVGGTINMNWWFTNHAVLLDTAGRLMFEEVKPGDTSEWREFLVLLKKNRPACPVNGLFLVIPSDSLIKDSADDIQKKAGKIAQQLDVIQRVLDVRFPVFVVVTKCDKINGFREFFDSLTDPQLQHQMMGWSNPNPLDDPFKPELVEKHLEQVALRLRRRRFALMRDPVPENIEGRRTDEVDTLYALPHSLELLSSRLKTYLQTIFIAGEWSAKPLFLRGIYFSSSMREGSALDAELAEAIGVGVDDLPEGKVWERERAYFLRDLFVEKVFKEKGLVTRATNTKRMLRSQQIALLGFSFSALVIFSVLVWFAKGSLHSSVKGQSDSWRVVSEGGWENKFWKQSIVPILGDGSFARAISTNAVLMDSKPVTLGEFHAKLRDTTDKPLKRNLLLPGLAGTYNQNSKKAQRIVFEDGVVRPLLEATRQKMRNDRDPGSAPGQPDALAGLIQLESDILSRGVGANKGLLTQDGARKFLSAFENYIAGKEVTLDTNLVSVMAWTYSTNDTAKGSWPPKWLGGVRSGANTLTANSGIGAGLDFFASSATKGVQMHQTAWDDISALRTAAKAYADSEAEFFKAAADHAETRFLEAHTRLQQARKQLEEQTARLSNQPLFATGLLLTSAQQKFQTDVTASAGAAVERVRQVNDAALAANPNYQLFVDIRDRLNTIQGSISESVKKLLASGDQKEFQHLDETVLADNGFHARADLYARAETLRAGPFFDRAKLIGSRGAPLEKVLTTELGQIKTDGGTCGTKLRGDFKGSFDSAVKYYLELAEKAQSEEFFKDYQVAAKGQMAPYLHFPLSGDTGAPLSVDNFKAAGRQLKALAGDLDTPLFQKYAADRSEEWKRFSQTLKRQQGLALALLGDDDRLGTCAISLAPALEPAKREEDWRGSKYRHIKLKCEGCTGQDTRTDSADKIGEAPVQQKLELLLTENALVANSATHPVPVGEWGPLWAIYQSKDKAERDAKDGSWLVEFPFQAPKLEGSGMMRLKIKFERPLPKLEDWPMP